MVYLNIFFTEIYKIIFLLIPVLVSVALIVWLDRRVWAFVQKRRGPNVVGPFGLLQTLADALKYLFKEINGVFESPGYTSNQNIIAINIPCTIELSYFFTRNNTFIEADIFSI